MNNSKMKVTISISPVALQSVLDYISVRAKVIGDEATISEAISECAEFGKHAVLNAAAEKRHQTTRIKRTTEKTGN